MSRDVNANAHAQVDVRRGGCSRRFIARSHAHLVAALATFFIAGRGDPALAQRPDPPSAEMESSTPPEAAASGSKENLVPTPAPATEAVISEPTKSEAPMAAEIAAPEPAEVVGAASAEAAVPVAPVTPMPPASPPPTPPPAPTPSRLLDQAYAQLAHHDLGGARRAFVAARDAGAPGQRVAIELGYLALAENDLEQAQRQFGAATHGPDAGLAKLGGAEAGLLPRHLWADLYAEAFGWSRSHASLASDDVVSTVRMRAFVRPWLGVDAQFYGFLQATRDGASRGRGAGGVPEIYADNYALAGVGLFLRAWSGRIGAFAQLGPALNLLDDGRDRRTFEARAGANLGVQSARCNGASARADGPAAAFRLIPCLDGYVETTYVTRFSNNVIALGRGRAGATYLVTGSVAWQVLGELRVAADRNHDYYNNLADAGAVHRWRFTMAKAPFDLVLGAHVGRYLGFSGRDPAPDHLGYIDLRLVASTYVAF